MPAESGVVNTPAIDGKLVARLLDAQFPQWAHLPLRLLDPAGSDHVIYRLGETMSVRLPRGDWAAGQARKEETWLPRLAPRLPLAVPLPLGLGTPGFGYPWHWSVARWLDGSTPTLDAPVDTLDAALRLADFLWALQRLAPAGELAPGPHDDLAGTSLHERDHGTRAAIKDVAADFDGPALIAVWEEALGAPAWDRPPVWFHGDLHPGNLLAVDGRVSAVIDFGGLGMGDPACDLVIAWTLLTAETRAAFRTALRIDDATWARGRGWALTTGLNAYAHYAATNPRVARNTRHQITQVLTGSAPYSP
ncbi:aminoglycoside phosphotransferase family protein [Streptomyces sp. NBC_01304]|uniref:aminoglycoside phosphotransferase family protein n=1 Tax=Streptomyces sp. NBC_01304 TaxID=2903818 RepID=UPI002E11C443|nr:aminoglycoside phosphotransferase family protein [Streptomyces sp. NBC_01304]